MCKSSIFLLIKRRRCGPPASMPLVLGGVRVRTPAYWSSSVGELEEPSTPFFSPATKQPEPSQEQWGLILQLVRCSAWRSTTFETQMILSQERNVCQGWQHEASRRVEEHHREELFTRVSDQGRAQCFQRGQ